MKHDPIGGALVILFAAIAGFVLCEMLSVPSKHVLEASGAQERAAETMAWVAFTQDVITKHPKRTFPEWTNGVWVIRFAQ